MTRKRKKLFISIVLLILFTILCLAVALFIMKHIRSNFEYYSGISDYEWVELEYYNGNPHKYLGKYPDNIFCNVYDLDGCHPNELLYLSGSDVVGFGSNKYSKILLNKEFEEPLKRLAIKEIVITKPDNSTIKIDDVTTLNQIEQVLKNQTGDTYSFDFDQFNASVYFGVDCDLFWSCVLEKRTDGSLHLIGYDQKKLEFRDYDMTSILSDIVLY